MTNVLHVISDTNVGGAGMHLVSLVNSLNIENFNVFVACPKNAQIINLIHSSVNIIQVSSMKGDKSLEYSCIYELTKIIKDNSIDIVHTHGSLSGRIAAKLTGRKIVFTRHTPGLIYKRNSLKWIINKHLNLFLCDKVIAVSKYIESQLLDYGFPKEKIELIYNGIDVKSFKENLEASKIKKIYDINDETVLLIIARLEEIKGHKYLLKAFHQLIRENYNLKLLIVGSGSKENEIKEFIKSNSIERNVILTGTIKDIKHVISISDIIILPSLMEALGLALIEGMCMAKPCIASDVDGIPEVVENGKNGILVKPKDISGLKNAILKLVTDEDLRKKMGQEGKRIVQEKFSLENMIEKIQQLYFDLLN